MSFAFIHPEFRLNSKAYTDVESLIDAVQDEQSNDFIREWFNKEDGIVVQTSGSTGIPKKMTLLKQHMINSAYASGEYFNLPAQTKALCCLSSSYIAGKMMWVRALTLGWHLDVIPPSNYPLEHNRETYDFSAMVPLQVQNSLSKLGQIKTLIVGGGAVSLGLLNQIKKIDTKVYATYGMTETSSHIAIRNLKLKSPVYQVLPNVTIAVDQRGCLVIFAPHLLHEKIITNDLVKIKSAKSFEWLGRFDSVINSGGVKLIPEQIEAKLSELITQRFFVAGIPDERWGEKLVLFVEGAPNPKLYEAVSKLNTLHRYEVPKDLYFIPKFKETHTGKVQRKESIALALLNQ
ncbi:AMP-binding protein [Flavobacteriaceae bacterium F08102]|nr:AMP-binding protein [Flavobacteriaceae bacterium F08102]